MKSTAPTCPELLCILLFMAFVVGLAYMGLNVARHALPALPTTMEIMSDPTSVGAAVAQ